jgi:hypothetical protein
VNFSDFNLQLRNHFSIWKGNTEIIYEMDDHNIWVALDSLKKLLNKLSWNFFCRNELWFPIIFLIMFLCVSSKMVKNVNKICSYETTLQFNQICVYGLRCLTPLSTIFQLLTYIMAVSLIGGGNQSTCRKPLTAASHESWNELTTLVLIGTDCTGSCLSNYHMIMTTMAPCVYE